MNLEFAGINNGDGLAGLARLASDGLNLLHNIESLKNLSEDNVLAVQPRSLNGGDEELRSVG